MANITVYPTTLRWAVRESDADPSAIAHKKGLADFPEWLMATDPLHLSFSKLSAIGKVLNMPFGSLVRSVSPEFQEDAVIRYRTIGNQTVEPTQNLRDIIRIMRGRQSWARDEMVSQGLGGNLLVGSVSQAASARELADAMREKLSLQADWSLHKDSGERFRYVRDRASDAGLLVMIDSKVGTFARRLDVHDFRAFVLLDDIAPLIFINCNDSYAGMLFSLLHEIGHVLLGLDEVYNDLSFAADNTKNERVINRAVVMSVVNDVDFHAYWRKSAEIHGQTQDVADACAKRYGLSGLALTIYAHQLGLATEEDIRLVRMLGEERTDARTSSGGNQNRTNASHLDTRFVRLVSSGIERGTLGYSDGLSLLGLKSIHAYDGLLEEKGMIR
jgi:Zn-dependent peptidase ImmA (M78 family)